MKGFYRLDSPFMVALSKAFDCIVISVLWFFGSLPILTMAASTNALYETMQKSILADEGNVVSTFWSAYKRNFLQGVVQSVLLTLILFPFILCIIWSSMREADIPWIGAAFAAMGIVCLAAVQTSIYIFTLLRSTDYSFLKQLEIGFILGIRHELTSISLVVILLAACFVLDIFPYLAIIVPAGVVWLYGKSLNRIAEKYPAIFMPNEKESETE